MTTEDNHQQAVRERKKAIILALSETERTLLSKVILLERQNLHLKRPRITADLVRIVKEVIK
jgi:hypothetical protein